jgi:predicted nucleic acid-binding protein
VAVKWVVREEHTEAARDLLIDATAQDRPVIAPAHLPGEVTNTIYQRWRSTDPNRFIPEDLADAALLRFFAFEIELLNPPRLHEQAYAFAKTNRISSIYDSLYVVLAQLIGVDLWTADLRLLRECNHAAPWVRFIGDYQRKVVDP